MALVVEKDTQTENRRTFEAEQKRRLCEHLSIVAFDPLLHSKKNALILPLIVRPFSFSFLEVNFIVLFVSWRIYGFFIDSQTVTRFLENETACRALVNLP